MGVDGIEGRGFGDHSHSIFSLGEWGIGNTFIGDTCILEKGGRKMRGIR